MDVSSIILMVISGKRKAYPYFACGALCWLYSMLYMIVNKPPVGLTGTVFYEVICICEKLFPAIIFIAVLMLCRKRNEDGKSNLVPCVISGVICAVRIARFIWVRHYLELLRSAGESAFGLTDLGIVATNVNTIVMFFLFFALSISLIWHLKKYNNA